jgi:hypothetical protein
MLPIDPNTATATDQEYDLGVSDYRWRTNYLSSISLSISLGSSQILSGTTAGGFQFVKDSVTTFKTSGTNFYGYNATPMGLTSTAARGQIAVSSALNSTLAAGAVSGSTCTLTNNGRPIALGLMLAGPTSGASGIEFSYVSLAAQVIARVIYLENGNTIGSDEIGVKATTGNLSNANYNYQPQCFGKLYFPQFTGTNVYSLQIDMTTASASIGKFNNVRLYAYEL